MFVEKVGIEWMKNDNALAWHGFLKLRHKALLLHRVTFIARPIKTSEAGFIVCSRWY